MNSFEYAATVKNSSQRNTTNGIFSYADVTVNVYAIYDYAESGHIPFYRIIGFETSWQSNISSKQVYKLDLSLNTIGDLHSYPELTTSIPGSLVQSDYRAPMCQINATYPIRGQFYSDYSHPMPPNKMLRFSKAWYASLVGFSMQLDGSTQVYTSSLPILRA